MKMWELVKDFQLKFPNLVKDLEQNTHHWDRKNLNIFHLEGNTYAHLLMSCLMAETFNASLLVKIATICHDLGKPMSTTRVEDRLRVRMNGHEGQSVFLALDYLNTLELSNEDKVRICQLISFHTYLYKEMRTLGYEEKVSRFFSGEVELFKDLLSLTRVDSLGRFAENENRDIWINVEKTFDHVLKRINPFIHPRKTRGEVIILVGPPMSGKSTWVKNNSKDHLVLSRDQLILDMAKTNNYNEAYKLVDKDKINQTFENQRRLAIKSGKDIILDLTHMSQKSRRKSLAGIPKEMKRTAIVFLVGYETLLKRNTIRSQSENKEIPKHILENMMGQFSMPMKSEGFDEIEYIFEKE